MIHLVSISAFRDSLDALLKVKRGIYGGIIDEICNVFKGVSIEQIRNNRDMILMDNDSIIIKLRLPDKKQRLSKSDGYRLIYMVMKNMPLVVLLTIYPKRGPMQKLSLEVNEFEHLLNYFRDEFTNNQLVSHDINTLAKL